MILDIFWHIRRYFSIKKGLFSPIDAEKIKLKLSFSDIEKIIKDYKLSVNPDFAEQRLKSSVYLKDVKNTQKDLKLQLLKISYEIENQFKKYFWVEYANNYMPSLKTSRQQNKRMCRLNEIYRFLSLNKKYQGYCGNEYQNSELYSIIKKISGYTFSMRAWGELMSAFMNSKKGKRLYDYMDFYYKYDE